MTDLKQRATLFADMAEGGYLQTYDIVDGNRVVGHKRVSRKNRKSPEVTTYFVGLAEFDNVSAFLAAVQKA
jgi:hypothetical protein